MAPSASSHVASSGTPALHKAPPAGYEVPPTKPVHHDPALLSFLGAHHADKALLQRINWLHVVIIFGVPLLALWGFYTTPLRLYTALWAVGFYFVSGLGITAGYHRYFAHRSYKVQPWFEWVLMLMGSASVQGSVKWWARDHRAHHRYVDTSKDPYAVRHGFWHAHVGWMLSKQEPDRIGRVNVTDLKRSAVETQHRWYAIIGPFMGFVAPALVASLWGDARGGFFFAGCARLFFVHHSTFFVNSLAHWAGDNPYTNGNSAKDSYFTALLTLGEGNHAWHHLAPQDYRNGLAWYQYDPTKVFIRALKALGIAFDLHAEPEEAVERCRLQMKQAHLHDAMSKVYWGPDPKGLPAYSMAEVQAMVRDDDAKLLVVDGFVLDVTEFQKEHPGGAALLRAELGKDCTAKFLGESYKHSAMAHNQARVLRVGRVTDAPARGGAAAARAKDE